MKSLIRFGCIIWSVLFLAGCVAPSFDLASYKKGDRAIVLIRGIGLPKKDCFLFSRENRRLLLDTVWRNVKTGVCETLFLPYWNADTSHSRVAFMLPPGVYTLVKISMRLVGYRYLMELNAIPEGFLTFEAVPRKVTYVGDLIWNAQKGHLLFKQINVEDATPVAQAIYEKTDLKEAAPYETRLMHFSKAIQCLKFADESMGILEVER